MSNRITDLRPPYPAYDPTPLFGGQVPPSYGPPDVWPSSLNPSYSVYAGTRGRNFAGLGDPSMMTDNTTADEGIRDYPNELNILAAADDVQGNGLFDPPGSHGNVHPDEGVFADHESLPGYIVRDRFYQPSAVIDGTTGDPVVFVPSGAVAIDQSQVDAYRATQQLYELPLPSIEHGTPRDQSIWIPREYSQPIGATEETAVGVKKPGFAALAIVGVAVGLVAAALVPVKRKGRR